MSRSDPDPRLQLLRHTVATLAYRGGKVLRDAPPGFATFAAGPGSRTPGAILAHLGDVLDWACGFVEGQERWQVQPAGAWDGDVERFFAALTRLDALLADAEGADVPAERLFQGPIADALTHVGQLAFLRRLSGAPIKGENYFIATIEAGRVGREQEAPIREFE